MALVYGFAGVRFNSRAVGSALVDARAGCAISVHRSICRRHLSKGVVAVRPLPVPDCISSLRLFGSTVRGELDDLSDIDVLAVYADKPQPEVRAALLDLLIKVFGHTVEVAEYEERRIRSFFETGHLFAWHLQAESVSIAQHEDVFFLSLPTAAPYLTAGEDAGDFLSLARGILDSVESGNFAPTFEAGLLFVASRNFTLCLSAAVGARPDFSRYSPYRLDSLPPYPLAQTEYERLMRCRKASVRGAAVDAFQPTEARSVAAKVVFWMTDCLGIFDEPDRT